MEHLVILVGIAAVVAVAVAAAPIMPPRWMKRLIVALLPAASVFDG